MAIPKQNSFRMVGDFRGINDTIESVPGPMPRQEQDVSVMQGATHFCTLDILQGYYQMPLAQDAQELFTIVTPDGLYTPTRVPQGVLNATSFLQGHMSNILQGLPCLVWVDDIVIYAKDCEVISGS